MKQFLVIAFEFPPIRSSNDRMYHFCRYLPEFGWNPIVIAPRKPTYYTYSDPSLKVPDNIEVLNADAMQSKIIFRTLRLTRLTPSADLFWISSYYQGKKLLKDRHREIRFIYATSPTPSAVFSAYWLAQEFSKPLVLDFRDPFERHILYNGFYRRILNKAHVIITTSTVYKNYLIAFGAPPQKITLIPNGTDLTLIQTLSREHPERDKEFTIVYAGIIYPLYRIKSLLKVVSLFPEGRIRVKIIGSLQCDKDNLEDFVSQNKLTNVEFIGRISQEATLRELLKATVAYNGSIHPGGLGSKSYDYIACGLPILGFNPADSATAEFISGHNIGLTADTEEGLLANLKKLYNNPALIEDFRQRALSVIGKFDRRKLTEQLSAVLNTVN